MNYRNAGTEDIDFLVTERLRFTGVKESDIRYKALCKNCHQYFEEAIQKDLCDIILAEEEGECIGTGIIFYYLSVPSSFNITGRNAYITSMYVKEEYRRHGIASAILEKLIENASQKGYEVVMLSASEMGRPLYHKRGFTENKTGMILDNRKSKE